MHDLAHCDDLVEGQDAGAELIILHPVTGEPMPEMVFIIAGPDSDIQKQARIKFSDALMAYRGKPPAADIEQLEIERLARCVVSWRVSSNGESVPRRFTKICALLKKFQFVREQVEAFAQSRVEYFIRATSYDEDIIDG